MDDRLVPRDATNLQANAQPKAVFFCAMTVMDKICGWCEEEKWVGSLFAACMWMYTKHVLCDGQETTQDFLKRKMLSMMESVNWVCEEVLEEHEWVSMLTISSKEEEVLRELNYEIDVPCVVQWRFLWFTAPSRFNVELHCQDARIIKCHEFTNLANEAAINATHGGHVTPRTRLVGSIAMVLDRLSEEDWNLDKEMIGWELGESLVLLLPVLSVEEIWNNDLDEK